MSRGDRKPCTKYGVREFEVRDPNGYLIAFAMSAR